MGVHGLILPFKRIFFSGKQLDGESLQEYSHALISLMDKVRQVSPDAVPQPGVLLRDQFIEHVMDSALRHELKRLVRQTPGLSMLKVQAATIRWECIWVGLLSTVEIGDILSHLFVPCSARPPSLVAHDPLLVQLLQKWWSCAPCC